MINPFIPGAFSFHRRSSEAIRGKYKSMIVEVTATKLFFHYTLENMELSVLPL